MKYLENGEETFDKFLCREGVAILLVLPSGLVADIPDGRALVCVTIDRTVQQASIICTQAEFEELSALNLRKRWYYVPKEKLYDVSDVSSEDFEY